MAAITTAQFLEHTVAFILDDCYGGDDGEGLTELERVKRSLAKLEVVKRDLQQRKSKLMMAEKKNQAYKYDRNNPGAFIPCAEWKLLDKDQMKAARDARMKDGILTRRVSLLPTLDDNIKGTNVDHGNDEGTGASMALDPGAEVCAVDTGSKVKLLQASLLVAEHCYHKEESALYKWRAKQVAEETVQQEAEVLASKINCDFGRMCLVSGDTGRSCSPCQKGQLFLWKDVPCVRRHWENN